MFPGDMTSFIFVAKREPTCVCGADGEMWPDGTECELYSPCSWNWPSKAVSTHSQLLWSAQCWPRIPTSWQHFHAWGGHGSKSEDLAAQGLTSALSDCLELSVGFPSKEGCALWLTVLITLVWTASVICRTCLALLRHIKGDFCLTSLGNFQDKTRLTWFQIMQ